jgi:peptide-methionine (S)-S-oxide reductase
MKSEIRKNSGTERKNSSTEIAIFAAGCFWGVEELFRTRKGVISTEVGYTGGNSRNPSYENVCYGNTEHAEAVKIEYDPSMVSYDELLELFWNSHNPTTLNRQGWDVGDQYRSAIFYTTEKQKIAAMNSKEKMGKSGRWNNPIVTQIVAAKPFYPAEEYHQKYLMKKGLKTCHI